MGTLRAEGSVVPALSREALPRQAASLRAITSCEYQKPTHVSRALTTHFTCAPSFASTCQPYRLACRHTTHPIDTHPNPPTTIRTCVCPRPSTLEDAHLLPAGFRRCSLSTWSLALEPRGVAVTVPARSNPAESRRQSHQRAPGVHTRRRAARLRLFELVPVVAPRSFEARFFSTAASSDRNCSAALTSARAPLRRPGIKISSTM